MTESKTLNVMQEQTVERMRIWHFKPYNGIRKRKESCILKHNMIYSVLKKDCSFMQKSNRYALHGCIGYFFDFTICHYEPYNGIRASGKQAYAGIQHRRKKQAVRTDKGIRAWSSWEHQQDNKRLLP